MSVRNISPSLQQSPSARDLRAIDMVARLLVAGIWLERQFGKAPKLLTISAAESGTSGPATKAWRFSFLTPRPLHRDER
jgi:hypothetical protein